MEALLKFGLIRELSEDETRRIIGGRQPNIYNPADRNWITNFYNNNRNPDNNSQFPVLRVNNVGDIICNGSTIANPNIDGTPIIDHYQMTGLGASGNTSTSDGFLPHLPPGSSAPDYREMGKDGWDFFLKDGGERPWGQLEILNQVIDEFYWRQMKKGENEHDGSDPFQDEYFAYDFIDFGDLLQVAKSDTKDEVSSENKGGGGLEPFWGMMGGHWQIIYPGSF